ncbi:phasin family protein [Brevundimonas goettingensis]|uniref:TIGR01841 family phasin n=1 Tax=Brevundimonas goettingensis TaxID=2774190 RepID=A0A975GXQ2_9CAUL|nr:TIGR01841 family phasin [Brevundimonas goettingensis]QTC93114.1 TIGR01841 family phasin [Brevundimonas goettingensis]
MADTAEAVKKTVEQTAANTKAQTEKVQAAGAQAFKDGLEKTTASLSELGAQSKLNLDAVVASTTAAQKGAEALSAQALSYGKSSWETGVAAAQSMSKARSVQELIELQTSFTKSAMEVYMAEMTKMTETLTSSVKDSFKPINERVTASVEKFQAAR